MPFSFRCAASRAWGACLKFPAGPCLGESASFRGPSAEGRECVCVCVLLYPHVRVWRRKGEGRDWRASALCGGSLPSPARLGALRATARPTSPTAAQQKQIPHHWIHSPVVIGWSLLVSSFGSLSLFVPSGSATLLGRRHESSSLRRCG
jgi:hypothetical protein